MFIIVRGANLALIFLGLLYPGPFSDLLALHDHNTTTQQTTPDHERHTTIHIYLVPEPQAFKRSGQFPHISGTGLAFGCPRVTLAGLAGALQLCSVCL